jgi:hypothetical protein
MIQGFFLDNETDNIAVQVIDFVGLYLTKHEAAQVRNAIKRRYSIVEMEDELFEEFLLYDSDFGLWNLEIMI